MLDFLAACYSSVLVSLVMSREIPSMNDVSEDDNEEDVETMTASEALQKLEEVLCFICRRN